jgi:hypothetical protein
MRDLTPGRSATTINRISGATTREAGIWLWCCQLFGNIAIDDRVEQRSPQRVRISAILQKYRFSTWPVL